jgi:hypothetical protein
MALVLLAGTAKPPGQEAAGAQNEEKISRCRWRSGRPALRPLATAGLPERLLGGALQADRAPRRPAGSLQPNGPLPRAQVDYHALAGAGAAPHPVVGAVRPQHVPLHPPPPATHTAFHAERLSRTEIDPVGRDLADMDGRTAVVTHLGCSLGDRRVLTFPAPHARTGSHGGQAAQALQITKGDYENATGPGTISYVTRPDRGQIRPSNPGTPGHDLQSPYAVTKMQAGLAADACAQRKSAAHNQHARSDRIMQAMLLICDTSRAGFRIMCQHARLCAAQRRACCVRYCNLRT